MRVNSWPITWYICRDKGKELWRVPKSIGPIRVEHNHWAGAHLDLDQDTAERIAQLPVLEVQLAVAQRAVAELQLELNRRS